MSIYRDVTVGDLELFAAKAAQSRGGKAEDVTFEDILRWADTIQGKIAILNHQKIDPDWDVSSHKPVDMFSHVLKVLAIDDPTSEKD